MKTADSLFHQPSSGFSDETATMRKEPHAAPDPGAFPSHPTAYVTALERAYLHVRDARWLNHGTYRKWQRPIGHDEGWCAQVMRWARGTMTGPWCVPDDICAAICLVLDALITDSEAVSIVELRQIAERGCELVIVVVTSLAADGSERSRLVGMFTTGGPDALIRHYVPRVSEL